MRHMNTLGKMNGLLSRAAVCGSMGAVVLLGTSCGESTPDQDAPVVVTVTKEAVPTTDMPPTKTYKAQPGTIANTENAAGVEEGTWTYRGPGDTPADREKARSQPLQEGATVQVLCHEDGRVIDLSQQSPQLGIPETDDWFRLDTPPEEAQEWVPEVFVDTARAQPVEEC